MSQTSKEAEPPHSTRPSGASRTTYGRAELQSRRPMSACENRQLDYHDANELRIVGQCGQLSLNSW
jgi:hypothetical protein